MAEQVQVENDDLGSRLEAALVEQAERLKTLGLGLTARMEVLEPLEKALADLQRPRVSFTQGLSKLSDLKHPHGTMPIFFRASRHSPEIIDKFGLLERKRFICCMDLELTCWAEGDPEKRPKEEMEIIEIGIVVLAWEKGSERIYTPVNEISVLVRPTINPQLSDFCKQLTGITQAGVNQADPLVEVVNKLKSELPSEDQYVWAAWGKDPAALQREFTAKSGNSELCFDPRFINASFNARLSLGRKLGGLRKALAVLGIEQVQPAHRGLPDAKSLVRLVERMRLDPLDAMVSSGKSYRERIEGIQNQLVDKFSRRYSVDRKISRELLNLVKWDAQRARAVLKLFAS